jgi:hypothetical protein
MLLSHLQNKFVNIITQKMSTLQQIRISNKIWQINQRLAIKTENLVLCFSQGSKFASLFSYLATIEAMSLSPSHLPTSPARNQMSEAPKKGGILFVLQLGMHPQISPNQTKLQQTPTTQQQTPKKREKGKEKLDVFVSRRKDRNPEKSWPATNE